MELIDAAFWNGRRVLVTGHTGFKGGWLSLWLNRMGASVTGFALEPPTRPSLFETAGVAGVLRDVRGDIRDPGALGRAVAEAKPQVVFHLAAQPIVREGYREPLATYATNVVGTAAVLDACRAVAGLAAIVCITTDKCYENRETGHAYSEGDRLGGRDPYSSSKACAELVVDAYRASFFSSGEGRVGVATARAGNVLGGGDWAADRLVPDLARAARSKSVAAVRNPGATRPWQHVLDPLAGYLVLAQRLAAEPAAYSEAWNFGPDRGGDQTVANVVAEAERLFAGELRTRVQGDDGPHEAGRLMLDSTKAHERLGWRPRLDWKEALRFSVEWYRTFMSGGAGMRAFSEQQIEAHQR